MKAIFSILCCCLLGVSVVCVGESSAQARRSTVVQTPADIARNYLVAYLNWELARDAHPRDYLPGERPSVDEAHFRWDPLSMGSVILVPLDTLSLGSDSMFVFIGGVASFHGVGQVVGVTRRLEVFPLFGFDTSMVNGLMKRYASEDDGVRRDLAYAIVSIENRAYRRNASVHEIESLNDRALPSTSQPDRLSLWSVSQHEGPRLVLHFFDFGDAPSYVSLRVR